MGLLRTAAEPRPETGEVRLLEVLAGQLSGASTTRELFTEIKGVLFSTVKSLVAAIDAKDAYTKGHSHRVYAMSVRIGERFGLSEDVLQTLTWSALLHDVGKIAIPHRILCKPGRLTPEEFEIIKTHPERGCLVIQPIPQFRSLLPGIRHHHERFDGRGYPDGLAGRDIPLMARIIAVADTFDAMVSTRAYRDARPFDDAIREIRDSAGTQLDPDIAAAFLDLVERGEITAPEVPTPVPEAA